MVLALVAVADADIRVVAVLRPVGQRPALVDAEALRKGTVRRQRRYVSETTRSLGAPDPPPVAAVGRGEVVFAGPQAATVGTGGLPLASTRFNTSYLPDTRPCATVGVAVVDRPIGRASKNVPALVTPARLAPLRGTDPPGKALRRHSAPRPGTSAAPRLMGHRRFVRPAGPKTVDDA